MWLARKITNRTGAEAGSAGAVVQGHWMAAAESAGRGDADTERREMDEMVRAAQAAEFGEVVAAVDRVRLAAMTNSEPWEVALKGGTPVELGAIDESFQGAEPRSTNRADRARALHGKKW